MRYAALVAAVFAARFLATAISYPQSDGDIEWQRWLGARILAEGKIPRALGPETFSAPGAYWLPQEWLFSIAAYLSHGVWWPVFAGIVALCPLVAILLVALRAQRAGASDSASAILVAFAGIALLESFGVRVQVVAWPLLAAFLYLVERDDEKSFWAIAVAVVWANVHASVMLAPALALAMTVGTYLDSGIGPRLRRISIIAIGSLVATCINPFGWELPAYAIHLVSSPFKDMISEWRHTTIAEEAFAFAALPMLLGLVAFGLRGPNAWRDRTIAAAAAILMFGAARNIAIFAITCAPFVAVAATSTIPWLKKSVAPIDIASDRIIRRTLPIFAILLFGIVTYGLVSSESRTQDDQPRKAIAMIRSLPGHHRVFCADFAWCAFLISSNNDAVYLDSRADPYPEEIWKTYGKIVRLKPAWSKALDTTTADIVISGKTSAFESGLELSPGWRAVYDDSKYRVWTRQ